jgi:hypothetical protein
VFKSILVTLLCLVTNSVWAQQLTQNQPKKPGLIDARLEFRFYGFGFKPIPKVRMNLPEEVRTVPVHVEDGTGSRVFPNDQYIARRDFSSNLPLFGKLQYEVMPGLRIWRVVAKAGFLFQVPIFEEVLPNVRDVQYAPNDYVHELNVFGQGRGYGSSLVYLSPYITDQDYVDWPLELEFKITKDAFLTFGSVTHHLSVEAETGWDRYDDFEKFKTHKLGQIKMEQKSIGIMFKTDDDDLDIRSMLNFGFTGSRMVKTSNTVFDKVPRNQLYVEFKMSINIPNR